MDEALATQFGCESKFGRLIQRAEAGVHIRNVMMMRMV